MSASIPEAPEKVPAKDAPGPSSEELRETFERYMKDPISESVRLFQAYGDVVAMRRGPFTTILLFHPDHAKHVLVTHGDRYSKKTTSGRQLRATLGDGVITSENAAWARQRRVAQPTFTKRAIDVSVPAFNRIAETLTESWLKVGSAAPIDVHHKGGLALLNLAGSVLMSEQFGDEKADELRVSVENIARLPLVPSANALSLAQGSDQGQEDFAKQHEAFLSARSVLDAVLSRAITERRCQAPKPDTLSALIDDRDAEGNGFSDTEIREQLRTLVIAGHDTTMTTLSISLLHLATHPEILTRVREEVSMVVGEGDVTPAHLDQLIYTEAVVAETLRLYPPVPHLDRRAEEEDVISGYRIPKGAAVALCPYVVQRRGDMWEQPNEFRPERFLGRPPNAYFPFGLGPHICLGRALSLVEAKLFLAHIVRRFDLKPVPGFTLELESHFTFHPKGDSLPLWVVPR